MFFFCSALRRKKKTASNPNGRFSKTHFSGTNGAEAAAVSKQPAEKLLVITERGSFIYAHSAARLIPLAHFPLADLLFNLFIFCFLSEGSRLALCLECQARRPRLRGIISGRRSMTRKKREGETGEQWGEGREQVR